MTSGQDDARFSPLMRDAQAGNARAYGELLRELAPVLRRVIARRQGFLDDADIEDLVQDVLFSLHQVRASYDPSRAFLPWLLAIVRNRMADGARRHRRTTAREVSLEELAVTFSDRSANTDVEAEFDTDALHQAIADLPAGQRQAVTLLKLKEMSLHDVAAQTGLSAGALKVAMHRALASLRKKMTGI